MSVNKVILLGNLGADPKTTYLKEGTAVSSFPLATTERGYTAKNGTVVPDRTEWHNVVLWRGLAEIAEKYLHKGNKVYIEGKLRTRSYEDTQGTLRYVTEIVAENMEMLTPPAQPQQTPQQPVQQIAQPATHQQITPMAAPQQTAQPAAPQQGQLNYRTDDLPF